MVFKLSFPSEGADSILGGFLQTRTGFLTPLTFSPFCLRGFLSILGGFLEARRLRIQGISSACTCGEYVKRGPLPRHDA